MKLFDTLFPKAAELAAERKTVESLTVERDDLKRRLDTLWTNYNKSEAASNGLRTELETAKAKLREQNDADLMLVSARIVLDILKDKKPSQNDLSIQRNLLNQQAAMGSGNYGYGYGGALQALGMGLGGLLGPFNH